MRKILGAGDRARVSRTSVPETARGSRARIRFSSPSRSRTLRRTSPGGRGASEDAPLSGDDEDQDTNRSANEEQTTHPLFPSLKRDRPEGVGDFSEINFHTTISELPDRRAGINSNTRRALGCVLVKQSRGCARPCRTSFNPVSPSEEMGQTHPDSLTLTRARESPHLDRTYPNRMQNYGTVTCAMFEKSDGPVSLSAKTRYR